MTPTAAAVCHTRRRSRRGYGVLRPDASSLQPASASSFLMTDQNITATPYPFYATGGQTDDSFKAALISHQGASIERNQDAQFSAGRDAQLARDVAAGTKDAEIRALEVKADLLAEIKDHERRSVERDAVVREQLAAIRMEHVAQESARVSRELAKVEADSRQAKTDATLAAILAKLSTPTPTPPVV